jgi:hypothetical protein
MSPITFILCDLLFLVEDRELLDLTSGIYTPRIENFGSLWIRFMYLSVSVDLRSGFGAERAEFSGRTVRDSCVIGTIRRREFIGDEI